ncbi:MAG: hypothetical protein GY903_25710 [Fuerstiella sp.]|nr:hypothetical protein [Fuerstiella sp.]MCP4785266.1 hypothetical protein [Fuerstiella sp.]MCP4857894.1 hypothetical protein [Fuerstiella sp.]
MPEICISRSVVVLFFLTAGAMASAQTTTDSGIADIDQIRQNVHATPTGKSNLLGRRAALIRWWRFLWHQGYDTSAYNDTWNMAESFSAHQLAFL